MKFMARALNVLSKLPTLLPGTPYVSLRLLLLLSLLARRARTKSILVPAFHTIMHKSTWCKVATYWPRHSTALFYARPFALRRKCSYLATSKVPGCARGGQRRREATRQRGPSAGGAISASALAPEVRSP